MIMEWLYTCDIALLSSTSKHTGGIIIPELTMIHSKHALNGVKEGQFRFISRAAGRIRVLHLDDKWKQLFIGDQRTCQSYEDIMKWFTPP
jgi:hypothetical protein